MGIACTVEYCSELLFFVALLLSVIGTRIETATYCLYALSVQVRESNSVDTKRNRYLCFDEVYALICAGEFAFRLLEDCTEELSCYHSESVHRFKHTLSLSSD